MGTGMNQDHDMNQRTIRIPVFGNGREEGPNFENLSHHITGGIGRMPENKWISWMKELQDLSQCALAYCRDKYDIERFERIREISAEMASEISGQPLEEIRATFCAGTGYQTPKMDTRSAVFRDGKILLVQEANGSWALPGGWIDYNQTIRSNAAKEVLEESGMTVEPVRLIALFDHNRRNGTFFPSNVCSAFVMCRYISGDFRPNPETIACGFFGLDELPALLAEGKSNREQIEMCFRAAADENWSVIFD